MMYEDQSVKARYQMFEDRKLHELAEKNDVSLDEAITLATSAGGGTQIVQLNHTVNSISAIKVVPVNKPQGYYLKSVYSK